MKTYFAAAKFNFCRMLAYPWELAAFFAGRIIMLGFLVIFWHAVSKSNSGIFDFKQLLSYFLITSAVRDLTLSNSTRFGRGVQKQIKNGEINNILIKPVKEIQFLLANFIGQEGIQFFYAASAFIAGFIIFPPKNVFNAVSFILFLFLTFFISISINIFLAILGFYSPEASGIQNVANHIIRILCGTLIPLNYFPGTLKKIAMLSPFPALAFTPTYILQNQLSFVELSQLFAVGIFWAVFLIITSSLLWKKSLKKYEGVGI